MARDRNVNVLDDDSWNDMYTDKEPRDWAGYDRPAKRSHPRHPDDRPATTYSDSDNDPGHDQGGGGDEKVDPTALYDNPGGS